MDAQFFADQVRLRERSLYRIAVSYLRHDMDAADAVQDALVTAWEKRHSLRQPAYFGSWLTRILINRCKQKLRQRRPELRLTEQTAVEMPDSTEGLALRMALDSLDMSYRMPLILYHLDGYSVKEVAHILRLSQSAVKSRLARGRRQLKDLLNDEEGFVYAQH